jgi:hypothetical protein
MIYEKTIYILGISIPIQKTVEYNPTDFISDAIMLDKTSIEQEIMSYLCWKQFLDSQSTCSKIQDYFSRISKEYSKDYILHQKTT